MRTTLQIDDQLVSAAKRLALETNRTLTAVIEDALRAVLAAPRAGRAATRVKLPVSGRGGVRAGVDLDDSSGLRDRMDGG